MGVEWGIYLGYCFAVSDFIDTIYQNYKVKFKPKTQTEISTILFLVGGGVNHTGKRVVADQGKL